jgi:glycosyltransferase involved in cell wall biosynthesis
MRICMLVSASLPPREGMGFYVWNLSLILTQKGHQVHIITRGGLKTTTQEIINGITIWHPTFVPIYPFHVHLHNCFVQKIISDLASGTDIFHLHSPLIPVISTDKPILFTVHSSVSEDVKATKINSFYSILMKLQAPISYRLEKQHLQRATKVTSISSPVADVLKKYPGCPKDIEISSNGVNADFFTPDPNHNRSERIVLTVGRLAPGKGLEELIQAASEIHQKDKTIQFLIVGDGPHKPVLRKMISDFHLDDCVRLIGHISDLSQLLEFYRKAKIFIMPSHHEGLPTVVLEAMASGCPVIATKVGGIPDIIIQGENGVMVKPGSSTQLSESIMSIIYDDLLLQSLAQRARQTIEERFTWEIVGSRFIDLYNNMIRKSIN